MALLDSSLGSILIGVMLSLLLYGIVLSQAYTYYQQLHIVSDRLTVKIVVVAVIIVEGFHTALVCAYIYSTVVTNFGNLVNIELAQWTLAYSQPVASLAIGFVQAFFAWRVRCVSQHWPITIISWTGSAVRLGSAFAIAIVSHKIGVLPIFLEHHRWILTICLSTGAGVDMLNTAALCYYLWKSRPEITKSKRMVETLILWTIETGALTCICTLIALITSLAMPNNFIFLCFTTFTTKVYSNSLLASLNGRSTLRTTAAESTRAISFSSFHARTPTTNTVRVEMVPQRSIGHSSDGVDGRSSKNQSDTVYDGERV